MPLGLASLEFSRFLDGGGFPPAYGFRQRVHHRIAAAEQQTGAGQQAPDRDPTGHTHEKPPSIAARSSPTSVEEEPRVNWRLGCTPAKKAREGSHNIGE